MSGERSQYVISMAERGAQRVADRIAMIADRYGPPPKADDVITLAEMMKHYEDFGHALGDENCTEPICERARRMVAGALAAIAQQPRGAQQ